MTLSGKQLLCLQFTQNLNVIGAGGISDIDFSNSADNLGLKGSGSNNYSQEDWLTDIWGNIDAVPGASDTGGDIYWSDFGAQNCTTNGNPGCPVYGGAVWRAGWSMTAI
jgi:hypothetical protein